MRSSNSSLGIWPENILISYVAPDPTKAFTPIRFPGPTVQASAPGTRYISVLTMKLLSGDTGVSTTSNCPSNGGVTLYDRQRPWPPVHGLSSVVNRKRTTAPISTIGNVGKGFGLGTMGDGTGVGEGTPRNVLSGPQPEVDASAPSTHTVRLRTFRSWLIPARTCTNMGAQTREVFGKFLVSSCSW